MENFRHENTAISTTNSCKNSMNAKIMQKHDSLQKICAIYALKPISNGEYAFKNGLSLIPQWKTAKDFDFNAFRSV